MMTKFLGKILLVPIAGIYTATLAQTVSYQNVRPLRTADSLRAYLGVAAGDYDNDGDEDLYFSSQNASNCLYENTGNSQFYDVTQAAGVQTNGRSYSAVWGDVDNDGDLDLFAAIWKAGNRLFLNNGDKTFRDATVEAGLDLKANSVHAVMADVENDGFLDLYLTINDEGNRLYHNNGNGTFSDVTASSGAVYAGRAMAAGFFDYDKDGDVDLYLVHDFGQANHLYQNDGAGHFVNVAAQAGVNFAGEGMGVDFGDYDNDGWLDMYIANMGDNVMYRNNGNGTFTDVTIATGTASGGMSWGCNWLDCDNDGWLDVFIANQYAFWIRPDLLNPNALFRNQGNGAFVDIAKPAGVATNYESFSSSILDFDNDGWVDIVVANTTAKTNKDFYRNLGGTNHWLNVQLEGTRSNRSAVGARVEAFAGSWRRVDEVRAGSGYNSQNSLTLEFGLGQRDKVDSLLVFWPSGISEKYVEVLPNQKIKIVEGQGIVTGIERLENSPAVPRSVSLRNSPNPFNPATVIRFELARRSRVSLSIYNLRGQEILELLDQELQAGAHKVRWHGADRFGQPLSSGVYFARLQTDGKEIFHRKMLLLK